MMKKDKERNEENVKNTFETMRIENHQNSSS